MPSEGGRPRFDVRVDERVLVEDLARCTVAARKAIRTAVAAMEAEGVPRDWLLRCQEEGWDGTRLGGCVKFYIPQPAGRWGAVLTADLDGRKPALLLIAVGDRHPERPWKPSVYEIAHRRLHM